MIKKLLASEVIEIDKDFLDRLASKLNERFGIKDVRKAYNVKEVALMRNKSEQTIRRHIKDEKIKAYKKPNTKSWIIKKEDYDNYINDN